MWDLPRGLNFMVVETDLTMLAIGLLSRLRTEMDKNGEKIKKEEDK